MLSVTRYLVNVFLCWLFPQPSKSVYTIGHSDLTRVKVEFLSNLL